MEALVDKIRRGDRRSLARAMSLVDEPGRDAQMLKDWLRRSTDRVPWWGITGPPGVGKSTLIDALLSMLRQRGRRVGVVAVDPTSPVSNGALLGDRVRMMQHAVDEDVFIRSLATHRREGGLSDAALHCGRLLELAGYDPVLIETVGVGQNEADIAAVADICVVLLGPGYGDDIQLIKAGLLEVADIVAVNKCDLSEANRLLQEVRAELGPPVVSMGGAEAAASSAGVEIFAIEAKSGQGVNQLLERLLEIDSSVRDGQERERRRARRTLGEVKRGAMLMYEQALDRGLAASAAQALVAKLQRGELSLISVIAQLGAGALTELQQGANDSAATRAQTRGPSDESKA